MDVLAKVILDIPQIRHWKIEGRKKGPHYVFYTVKAYQLLRDHGKDPQMKKEALALLEHSLGRKKTHYHFLPQRPQNPVSADGQTASGLFVGKIQGGGPNPYLIPREKLLTGDTLRIGYEDDRWHGIQKIHKYIPQKGRIYLKRSSRHSPPKGTPVFLIDRREKNLEDMLLNLEKEIGAPASTPRVLGAFHARLSTGSIKRKSIRELPVYRLSKTGSRTGRMGLWLSKDIPPKVTSNRIWWWLPPVTWPSEEKTLTALVDTVTKKGGRHFVLNAPWQSALFKNPKKVDLWAGPFCNVTNPLAIVSLAALGFSGVIVSPELSRDDFLQLPPKSPLPLGIVVSGNWPLCIARSLSETLKPETPFLSPKNEQAWVTKYDRNYWTYPNWKIDLSAYEARLKSAGYSLFVRLYEPVPRNVRMKKRPGLWNWELGLSK